MLKINGININRFVAAGLFVTVLWMSGCSDGATGDTDAMVEGDAQEDVYDAGEDEHDSGSEENCDALNNKNSIEIKIGEQSFCRYLVDYETVEFNVDNYSGTGVRLYALIDEEIAEAPEDWRYKIYGTDGYTFGGYLTWGNMLNGYIELVTRRAIFEPDQELDHSFFVKDSYLIVMSPSGD